MQLVDGLGTIIGQQRQDIERLVRKHRVVYQVFPASEMDGSERVHVGHDIDLLGAHEPHSRGLLPGCERCRTIWEDLHRIIEAVDPPDTGRVSVHDVAAFDRALLTRPGRDTSERDEVRLSFTIRHKAEYLAPIDACEDRCLREVVGGLRALGLQEGVWRENGAAART